MHRCRPALPRAGLLVFAVLLLSLPRPSGGGIASLAAQGSATLHGRVTDPSGLPVPGATVRLEGTGFVADTDASGRYRLTGVGPGRYQLVASAPGLGGAAVEIQVPREGEDVQRDVTLAPEVVALGEILTLVEREESSGLRRVLRRDEIERAGSVAAALERVPGVFVREFGPGGGREVSIRGASPDQTLVLWGEERLLAPGGGAFDLSTLAPATVDSIEVIVRGASSRHGAGALGGVVRIYPAVAASSGGATLEAGAGLGSLGMRKGSARVQLPVGGGALALAGATQAYARNFGRRENSGGALWDGSAALQWPHLGLGVSAAVHGSDRGAPGPVTAPTPRATIAHDRLLGSVVLERYPRGWALRGETSVQSAEAGYADPERPALASSTRETALAVRLGGTRDLSRHSIEWGLEGRRHRIWGDEIAGHPARTELGLYGGARWRPLPGSALTLSPGLRVDRIALQPDDSTRDAAPGGVSGFLSPSLAAALTLGPRLDLQGYAGRSFRYPGFQSLFFVSGLGVRSNPLLREERSRDLELGLEWRAAPALSATASVFHRRIDGAIVWLPDFQFIWSPRNLPRAVVRGIEVGARWHPSAAWELQTAYTYALARFDFSGNENPLPYRPAHLGGLQWSYSARRLRSAVDVGITGRRYPNLAGTNALPGYVLLNWSIGWSRPVPGGSLDLELRVENVLNRDYQVVFGFPAAGRTLQVSAGYRIR